MAPKFGTLTERLEYAVKLRGMNWSELSKKSGINKSSISQYKNGQYVPKQTALFRICEALQINEAWLMGLSDRIEPIDKTQEPSSEIKFETEKSPPSEEGGPIAGRDETMLMYESLPPEKKEYIANLIRIFHADNTSDKS